MTPEEKIFRLRLKKLCGICNTDPKPLLRDLSALIRAVRLQEREECVESARKELLRQNCNGKQVGRVAAALRERKS
jgi:hypothetical protein